jgi:phosphatidylserine/phosphatidylglycerophosphate/cardiolipin synthase-like enzyme
MSDILIKPGTITPALKLESTSPWSIRFTSADDLLMPFDGTVVLPAAAGTMPDFAFTGIREWMSLSLRYPLAGPGNSRKFPSLFDMVNRPVVTGKSAMIFAANDYSLFDDVHLSKLFTDIKESYDPVIKKNFIICTLAKYFLIEFDEGVFSNTNLLPVDLSPFACSSGFSLKTNTSTDAGIVNLRAIIATAGSLSGTIRAFDISGRETDTYSSLLNLGIPKTAIENAPSDDDEKEIKLQFVDIHGEVIWTFVFPLEYLDFDPVPVLEPGGANDPPFYKLTFTGTDRKMQFRLKEEGSILGSAPSSFHFHHVALWPGYNFGLQEIRSTTEWTSLDLVNEIKPEDRKGLRFIRICAFNPLAEFQRDAGGELEDKSYTDLAGEKHFRYKFKDNQHYIFTPYNKVSVYNSGDDFFRDFYKLVTVLKEKDRVYLTNWSSHPFVHLTGSMSVRRIEANDLDTNSIDQQLIKSRDSFLLLPVTMKSKGMSNEQWRAVYFPTQVNGNNIFTSPLQIALSTIPGPGEFTSSVHKTFVRARSPFAWLLKPENPEVRPLLATDLLPHRLLAIWKNTAGSACFSNLEDLLQDSVQEVAFLNSPFPVTSISVETNEADIPKLQIRRLQPMSAISSGGNSVCLLVINLAGGAFVFLPLNPPGADAGSSDLIITNASDYAEGIPERDAIDLLVNTFSAEDDLLFALCNPPSTPEDSLQSILLSDLWSWHFSNDAIRTGDVPLHDEELGGVLRKAVSNDVKVRAIYWEQFLSGFSPGDNLSRGLNNNESITNVINKPVAGKHGFALRDRTAREFGSWHQKASVIIQKDPEDVIIGEDKLDLLISYLGGLDLAMGRWDTQEHYEHDPDRQTRMFYDTHVRIEGEAGFDVLRNFAHRWKANAVFLGPGFEKFRPVNISVELTAELEDNFVIPPPGEIKIPKPGESNAFVQINRTIPSRSSLSLPGVSAGTGVEIPELTGEPGSLASYTKAVNDARKFIIINDQYFFSQEFALLLHQRLVADDGPDFLIIILPLNLDESDYIDPNLFQLRKLVIDILYFGGEVGSPGDNGTMCGKIVPPATGDPKVKNKVAIMTPVNTEGNPVYVHSKHIIVDDVWMSIGSANMNNRSLTFDGEINAAIVGNSLYKGRTSIVANQRIELCRQLLGLPRAYSSLLQDPFATFRLFKAIEQQQEGYNFRLHPQPLHTKWLDPLYKQKAGESAFDNNVDIVANLDFTDPSFTFLICNALDPDGRSNKPSRLGFFASLGGITKTVPSATANISFGFSAAADSDIRSAIISGNKIRLQVKMIIAVQSEEGPLDAGPFDIAELPLKISAETNKIVLDEGTGINTITFPISVTEKYTARLEIQDVTNIPGILMYNMESVFDPATEIPPITNGSVRDVSLVFA